MAEDSNNSRVMLNRTPLYRYNQIPNVVGMGARDAVYLVESRGVKVKMEGRGKVVEQSLEPGRIIHKGDVMRRKLEEAPEELGNRDGRNTSLPHKRQKDPLPLKLSHWKR